MKHGKTKTKASKASSKKGGPAGKSSKAVTSAKAKTRTAKASPKAPQSKSARGGAAEGRAHVGAADAAFTNPIVAAAFKHAVKKYPNALRKLTD